MVELRKASSSGRYSAVHLHLKDKDHSFENSNAKSFVREDRWFKRRVKKKAMYSKQYRTEQPMSPLSVVQKPSPDD